MPNLEPQLPGRVLDWAVKAVDPQALIRSVRPLYGSTSSTLHCLTLQVGSVERRYVVRQFDNLEWLQQEPDLARHEAASLTWAARTGLPVPGLIAFDETGSECGLPTVLMTHLKGSVVLSLPEPDGWLSSLAAALLKIHAVQAADFPWPYFTYIDLAALETPAWSGFPAAWETALALVKRPPPPVKPCFIHRDYHPANVLWRGHTISGVVDWVNACRGPVGIDLGHCRVNLAQMYGVPTADAFLATYQAQAGPAFRYDPYWDLLSLVDILFGPPQVYPGWAVFGLTGLTDAMMVERLDAYLLSLLKWSVTKPGRPLRGGAASVCAPGPRRSRSGRRWPRQPGGRAAQSPPG